MASSPNFYDFRPADKKGNPYDLSIHKKQVVLVVNTASKCTFTSQLRDLQDIYTSLSSEYPNAFTILAFPCNQFGWQDPGSSGEIQTFCQVNYGVSFPVLGKTEVNGPRAEPVWEWMKAERPGIVGLKRVKWNFEKFLISGEGRVVGRWGSWTSPGSLRGAIIDEIEKMELS